MRTDSARSISGGLPLLRHRRVIASPEKRTTSEKEGEEKDSLSSEDDVDFDDVGVKAMRLIRKNIPISPLISA
jgi:hypothetical protein